MEVNRQRKGVKAKLGMSFYLAPKPSSVPYSNRVRTPPSSSMPSTAFFGENDEFILSKPIQKPLTMKKGGGDRYSNQNMAYGSNSGDDYDNVDKRSATYIRCVQERFRLEQMECDA
ncbi:hypothetical protein HPP92_003172 [Vanilla planifolia]|uniref:Uncharacterized protein n=1 Tax=Vanilla planifolia TaxID=51239 RepID=A0A835RVD3_VANPL|nr:hypothetical protein HPP92_003565 [Vanilla planifolia]KAG0503100.1 hypothetical protein HPP92_003172 [Vanilla planifolia]